MKTYTCQTVKRNTSCPTLFSKRPRVTLKKIETKSQTFEKHITCLTSEKNTTCQPFVKNTTCQIFSKKTPRVTLQKIETTCQTLVEIFIISSKKVPLI